MLSLSFGSRYYLCILKSKLFFITIVVKTLVVCRLELSHSLLNKEDSFVCRKWKWLVSSNLAAINDFSCSCGLLIQTMTTHSFYGPLCKVLVLKFSWVVCGIYCHELDAVQFLKLVSVNFNSWLNNSLYNTAVGWCVMWPSVVIDSAAELTYCCTVWNLVSVWSAGYGSTVMQTCDVVDDIVWLQVIQCRIWRHHGVWNCAQ